MIILRDSGEIKEKKKNSANDIYLNVMSEKKLVYFTLIRCLFLFFSVVVVVVTVITIDFRLQYTGRVGIHAMAARHERTL